MDPAALIPTADAIPVPWGWHYVLLLVTFILHLLFMNTMLGTGMIAFVNEFRKPENAKAPTSVSEEISHKLTYIIAFTVNLGVAPLLFLQVLYGQFIYASSVLLATYWIGIVILLILAYYAAYIYNFRYASLGGLRKWIIGLTVLILLCIGFIFTNNMSLMIRPESWPRYFDSAGGTLLNLSDPTLFPRYLHFMVASAAVGGLFIALLATLNKKMPQEAKKQRINMGMQWFSYATLVQIMVGIWFLISIKREVMLQFMGGNTLNTLVFILALAAVMLLLLFGFKNKPWPAAGALLGTVTLMALMRDFVRVGYLQEYFTLSDLRLEAQYSPLILFVVVFLGGLLMVAYLLKLAAAAKKEV
jgi:hypothetical protein